MAPSVLQTKIELSTSKVSSLAYPYCNLESNWHVVVELFRTCRTVAPDNSSISTSVGTSGRLDLYVNTSVKWGIEILCESDRLEDHILQFLPGGSYEKFKLCRWVIINFCRQYKDDSPLLNRQSKPRITKEVLSNVWHVVYSKDYNNLTIKRCDLPDTVLTLQGVI